MHEIARYVWLPSGSVSAALLQVPRAVLADGAIDVVFSMDVLGGAAVVGSAEVAEVLEGGGSAEAARVFVIALEPGAGGATLAVGPAPGAAQPIAFEKGEPHGARDGLG